MTANTTCIEQFDKASPYEQENIFSQRSNGSRNRSKSRSINLAPSSLSFLIDCPACLRNKMLYDICQPSIPFAYLISSVNSLVAEHFQGKHTSSLDLEIPPGVFKGSETWIRSKSSMVPDSSLEWYINGRIDTLVEFEDGTYGIIDFKTSRAGAHKDKYSRQLHAYAYAFMNPELRSEFKEITELGLIYVNPKKGYNGNRGLPIDWELTYEEVELDLEAFEEFLEIPFEIIAAEKEPQHSKECSWGKYLNKLEVN